MGSTGSIGESALELIRKNPKRIKAEVLVAGSNHKKLLEQILEFKPKYAGISDENSYKILKEKLKAENLETELLTGEENLAELSTIVGIAGLKSTLSGIRAGKKIALANKESLVSAGKVVKEELEKNKDASLVPVDSEHSALFQAMQGHNIGDIKRLILTASGGPFFLKKDLDFSEITPEQAVNHPNWSMGKKISVDSASLMNKALELIEAYWLFQVDPEDIDVLVHPQSIIHSIVEFNDNSQNAQLSVPDMKGAIAYAFSYPNSRFNKVMNQLDLAKLEQLNFYPPDHERFPAINLARECLRDGGIMPAAFNVANEIAVDRFLNEKIKFNQIIPLVEKLIDSYKGKDYSSVEELFNLKIELLAKL
ncbi:UNVERIFIED_CONTAM: hypothetical protein GTU68_057021 [Idotea baltica]|nr:hypothetical protein [Idotea baltica]